MVELEMNKECCENCIYCHTLWFWGNYKEIGYCCTMLKDTGDDIVMQLTGDITENSCEEFTRKATK